MRGGKQLQKNSIKLSWPRADSLKSLGAQAMALVPKQAQQRLLMLLKACQPMSRPPAMSGRRSKEAGAAGRSVRSSSNGTSPSGQRLCSSGPKEGALLLRLQGCLQSRDPLSSRQASQTPSHL